MFSPLEQFEIVRVFSVLTNQSLTIIIGLTGLFLIFLGSTGAGNVKLNGWNTIVNEALYFIYSMVKEQVGYKEYFGVILTVFFSVMIFNLMGLVPYSFTATSHTVIAFALSVPVFLAVTMEAVWRHGFNFFSYFIPAGTPLGLIPLLVAIEIISYLARVVSLAVRLNANLLSGHILLHLASGTIWSLMSGLFVIVAILPFAFLFAFTFLELGIALLQAYVFTLLTCIYLKDAIDLH